MTPVIIGFVALLLGAGAGWVIRTSLVAKEGASASAEAEKIRGEAKREAEKFRGEAKQEADRIREEAKKEEKERRGELRKREDSLDDREKELQIFRRTAEEKTQSAEARHETLKTKEEELTKLKDEATTRLAQVAEMSPDAAKEQLLKLIEEGYTEEFERKRRVLEEEGDAKLARRAQEILLTAVQRYGASHAVDAMTSVVPLASEELKGRIIGKEGRNIKAFERATGCEVLVDEAPGAIVISSFDPVRREVARRALERLMEDGRIQPARFAELAEAAKSEVEEIIRQAGVDAVEELALGSVDPRLVYLVGRLRFRTSFGQSVLQHSIEVAHLAGMIAAEAGANPRIAKFGGLVHDIGKAVDHEVEGTHVEIGRKLLKRFNVDEEVIKAMQSHHEEYPFENPESVIVLVADALSAARPGARRDTVENYLKRLQDLEQVANSFEGVDKVYAIQAGREVRVFVTPEAVDDQGAQRLARDIADKIQQELHYPGEIKVTLIREKRVTEYAR